LFHDNRTMIYFFVLLLRNIIITIRPNDLVQFFSSPIISLLHRGILDLLHAVGWVEKTLLMMDLGWVGFDIYWVLSGVEKSQPISVCDFVVFIIYVNSYMWLWTHIKCNFPTERLSQSCRVMCTQSSMPSPILHSFQSSLPSPFLHRSFHQLYSFLSKKQSRSTRHTILYSAVCWVTHQAAQAWHVLTRDHIVLPATHVHPQVEPGIERVQALAGISRSALLS